MTGTIDSVREDSVLEQFLETLLYRLKTGTISDEQKKRLLSLYIESHILSIPETEQNFTEDDIKKFVMAGYWVYNFVENNSLE